MNFYANNSPLAGKDGGKFLTIHKIRERIEREEAVSVSVKIDPDSPHDAVKTQARGELQLAILIETMRREGYEMQISRPQVIFRRDEAGKLTEPYEIATLDVPEEAVGATMEEMNRRQGELLDMRPNENGHHRAPVLHPYARAHRLPHDVPHPHARARARVVALRHLQALRRGAVETRSQGSLISKDSGKLTRYAYEDVQERGTLFYPL